MIRLSAPLLSAPLALALLSAPALAGGYLYADFEASVPHIDLPECPEGMADRAAICRVTINNDALHIHVFAEDGEQPFIAVHTFYEDAFTLMLED